MKWLFSLLALVAVLVVGALVAPGFVDWNQYKEQALTQVTKFTGLQAEIKGDVSLAVLPSPRVRLQQVRVIDPSDQARDLVTLEEVSVHLAMVPLFSGQVAVSSVSLDAPNIRLVKNKEGVLNFMTPEIEALMGAKEAVAPDAGSNVQIGFENIEIQDGVFVYEDQQTKGVHKVEGINLDISADSLQGPFEGEGTLSYNGQALSFKGKAGQLEAQSAPVNVRLTIDGVQGVYDGVVAWGDAVGAQGNLTLNIPDLSKFAPGSPYKSFEARGALDASGSSFVLKDAAFQADDLSFSGSAEGGLQEDGITGAAKLRDLPGQGLVDLSVSGDKGFKSIGFSLKGQAANAPLLLSLVSDVRGMPLIGTSKKVVFDVKGTQTPAGLLVEDATINLDELKATASGSLSGQEGSDRQLLKVKAVVSDLDFDALSAGGGASGGDPLAGLKALALPMDVDVDVMINSATLQGQSISGLKLDAKILPNRIVIDDVGVQSFAGANAKVSGQIGDLKSLSGLDLKISGAAADPRKVAQAFKVDTSAWPKALGKASVDVAAKGTITNLNVDANVKALNGDVSVKGAVANPLTAFSMPSTQVRIKHRSVREAMKVLGIQPPAYSVLAKPLNFSMDLAINGQRYAIRNIQGDFAGSPVNGSIDVDLSGAKPFLGGDLRFKSIVLESPKGGGASSSAAAGSRSSGGKWSRAPLNSDWLHSMNAKLSIAADSLLYEGWDMDKPSMSMVLQDGVMTLSDLKAGMYDGQIGMNGTLSSAKPGAATGMKGSVSIQNVNMEPLVKAFAGERLLKGQGQISLQSDVSGAGSSMAALIGSLSGAGTVTGSSIVLDGIDVSQFVRALSDDSKPGDSLMGLWQGAGRGGSTEFNSLDGNFTITNGVIGLQKMLLDGPTAAIDTTGTINLPQWTIATNHKMAVKGAEGEDVPPPFTMKISGSLDNPGQTFAQGAINDYLQRKISRKLGKLFGDKVDANNPLQGVIGNLLGGGTPAQQQQQPANDNQPPAQQQEQPQQQQINPEDAVKDLLKGLF